MPAPVHPGVDAPGLLEPLRRGPGGRMPMTPPGPPLLVIADDWGRHPSSCQHLVRRLREDFDVLWVNSIGTCQVSANSITLRRGLEKLNGWRQGLDQVAD